MVFECSDSVVIVGGLEGSRITGDSKPAMKSKQRQPSGADGWKAAAEEARFRLLMAEDDLCTLERESAESLSLAAWVPLSGGAATATPPVDVCAQMRLP